MTKRYTRAPQYQIGTSEMCWAGLSPWANRVCFGDVEGNVHFVAANLESTLDAKSHPLATDAVNGFAFGHDLLACTSRSSVCVARWVPENDSDLSVHKRSYTGGAHGVVASDQDAFLAPIGEAGILLMKSTENGNIEYLIARPHDVSHNYYRLIRLGRDSAGEVFACAARSSGLIAMHFSDGVIASPGFSHRFEGHDIVDVCALNEPAYPFGVACLSRSRDVFLIDNILDDAPPTLLHAPDVGGTGYSLLSLQQNLLMLTNRELACFPDISSQLDRGDSQIRVASWQVEASDLFSVGPDAFVLIGNAGIAQFEMADFVRDIVSGSQTNGPPRELPANGSVMEISCDFTERRVTREIADSGQRKEFRVVDPVAAA